jgi:chromate transporter
MPPVAPSLAEATQVWARIAALSFGGPAGQIAVMHRILVDEKRWIGEARFLQALNFCMLLPGPEAQQLATYIGWLLHGVRGGLIAGCLFVLPGMLAIMGLSVLYALHADLNWVAGLFFGLKAAVLAVVVQAVVRIGSRALRNGVMRAVAALAFVAIFVAGLPFPLIVLGAGALGYLASRAGSTAFAGGGHGGSGAGLAEADSYLGTLGPLGSDALRGATRAGGVALFLWLVPVAALWAAGPSVYADIAVFFSKMAVVTFGGAYAVLAYVAQEAVTVRHWLAPGEMLDGLGLAETTPGPLIMVTQFVGFMGGFRAGGLWAGVLAGLLTTWVTFAPCFAWIFLGAPWMERLRHHRGLAAALAAVTAAVVGVIANLALWFALHFLFTGTQRIWGIELPLPGTLNPAAAALSLMALAMIFGLRWGVMRVLALSALAGMVLRLTGLS